MKDEEIHIGDRLKVRQLTDMMSGDNIKKVSHVMSEGDESCIQILFKNGVLFNDHMMYLCGKEFIVVSSRSFTFEMGGDGKVHFYNSLSGVEEGWSITADMLEPFDSADNDEMTVSSEEDLMSFLFW